VAHLGAVSLPRGKPASNFHLLDRSNSLVRVGSAGVRTWMMPITLEFERTKLPCGEVRKGVRTFSVSVLCDGGS